MIMDMMEIENKQKAIRVGTFEVCLAVHVACSLCRFYPVICKKGGCVSLLSGIQFVPAYVVWERWQGDSLGTPLVNGNRASALCVILKIRGDVSCYLTIISLVY